MTLVARTQPRRLQDPDSWILFPCPASGSGRG